eukprot:snap_masked-scaffold_3-processed-gene-21.59-mRNA-1 protein AED:1.00 eAED:1.00 QI:0/0/0/0/1/1/2/0/91
MDNDDCKLNSDAEPALNIHRTATTGYGTLYDTTVFFENYRAVTTIMYFQTDLKLVFNTPMTSIFFSQIGRAEPKLRKITFSNKVTINLRNG